MNAKIFLISFFIFASYEKEAVEVHYHAFMAWKVRRTEQHDTSTDLVVKEGEALVDSHDFLERRIALSGNG